MQKLMEKVVDCCDFCGSEIYGKSTCLNCGKVACFACEDSVGKEYDYSVYVRGSYNRYYNGYYCNKCDKELKVDGKNKLYNAYQYIYILQQELKDFQTTFEKKVDKVEKQLEKLIGEHNEKRTRRATNKKP